MSTPEIDTEAPLAAEGTAAPSTGDGTNATEQTESGTKSADEEVNWRERFEAQQKIARDLERKLKATPDDRSEELKSLRAEVAKLQGKEAEYEAAQEAQRVKDEALAAANERIVKAEIRAQAAAKLADPKDALRFLDLSEFEVDSDGEVDGDSVAAAIDDLIKSKPYLAAQGKRFQGDADGGARKESRPEQITRDELSRMTSEQIVQAKKDGRLSDLLGA